MEGADAAAPSIPTGLPAVSNPYAAQRPGSLQSPVSNPYAVGPGSLQSPISNLLSSISRSGHSLIDLIEPAMKYHEGGDTMNVIVRDATGHIVSAVTTSGVAWKYPGRVGDSPIVGAGQYADDRYGAAACTGMGELTIRHGTALRAVLALQMGMTLEQAGRDTIHDLLRLSAPEHAWIRLLLVDRDGNVGGYCTRPGATLKVQSVADDGPQVLTSVHVI
jgi:isoaspartyl peptidase/L-asparaginase-like protein (Ntn-hydrolase superfamily)